MGLPVAYLLAVKAGWGVKGLWWGLVLCTSIQGVVMLVVLSRFSWQKEAQRAAARIEPAGSDADGFAAACHAVAHGTDAAAAAAAAEGGAAGILYEDSAEQLSAAKHGRRGAANGLGTSAALQREH